MKKTTDLWFNLALLAAYLVLIASAILHHELWGDELHSWNIAKGNHSVVELMRNIRYEGHPPVWYLSLFCITQFSHNLIFLKALQFFFVAAAATVFIFFAPFSRLEKTVMLCGYYFVFEYAVLARNYMPGIFFAFILAAIFNSEFRFKIIVYYLCLFLLSNVHLVGLLLAISIHAGFCYNKYVIGKRTGIHVVAGLLLMIPGLCFILPPGDSQLNLQFWIAQWSVTRLYLFVTVIVKSLFPFQETFNYHWWNTNILLDNNGISLRLISLAVFFFLLFLLWKIVRNSKTATLVLGVNLICTFLVSLVFPLNTYRYVGFVFIGLIIASWITYRTSHSKERKRKLLLLAFLQVWPGIFALSRDHTEEFSSAQHVSKLRGQVQPGSLSVTDYWCLNSLSAYLDTSFYCIELGRDVSFLKWDSSMRAAIHYDYASGLTELLHRNQQKPFYYYSMYLPDRLVQNHGSHNAIRLTLISETGISIEGSGRIFLYRVEDR